MFKPFRCIRTTIALAMILLGGVVAANEPTPQTITYTEHVAAIVHARCVTCHHPGGVGPMSLASYAEVKGRAAMIREVVTAGRMPPWHADGRYGSFSNDRRLTLPEYETLLAWIDGGAPQGDQQKMPRLAMPSNGWGIGQPDVTYSMPQTAEIPAAGMVPYHYYETPTGFATDKWVQAIEARPGNAAVVHHILIYVRGPGVDPAEREALGLGGGMLTGYAPGNSPDIYAPGVALKIPANSRLLWQIHYTPTGKPETDRSQLGIKFADTPPRYEHKVGHALNARFRIPPRSPQYAVRSSFTFPADAWMTSLTPHMHLRGKSFYYEARYPNGQKETLLSVPKYDFNWQTTYELAEAKPMPRGTQINCVATFDNSANNPANPNPNTAVGWGEQTWEEMMIGWFGFVWAPGQ